MTDFIKKTVQVNGTTLYKLADGRAVNPQTGNVFVWEVVVSGINGYGSWFRSEPLTAEETTRFLAELPVFQAEDLQKRINKAGFDLFNWGGDVNTILKRWDLQPCHRKAVIEAAQDCACGYEE